MKNFFVPNYMIMDFEYYDLRNVSMHYHQNVEMIVVLEGELTIIMDEGEITLASGGFYIINVNRRHAFEAKASVLYVCIHWNFDLLTKFIDMNKIIIMCDSKKMEQNVRTKFEAVIGKIVNSYFAKSGAAQVRVNKLYYTLLDLIIEHCVVYSDDERFKNRDSIEQDRLNEIVNYVYSNYRDEISLTKLAENLYLSPAYLSKYIKSKLGMNFIDYVNNIRLYHAATEIKETDKKMTHIAIDNGFSNITAFNKAFKRIYDITPSQFREQEFKKNVELKGDDVDAKISVKARDYLNSHEFMVKDDERDISYVIADVYEQKTYNKYWKQMINISRMSDLLLSDVQKHVLILKNELEFTHIRFWDIYEQELNLNIESKDGVYNFGKTDRIFDFLYENGIYPYIELGFKPTILVEKLDGYIISEEKENIFSTLNEYKYFLNAMVTHYVNRYGIEYVEKWYFEQWKDPRLTKDDYKDYFDVFDAAYHTIKKFSSKIKIGGGSIHHTFDEDIYEEVIIKWNKRIVHPDFISIYSYPYHTGGAGQAIDRRRSQNPDYLKDGINSVRNAVTESGFNVNELHVSEWNNTVSNRNKMNDSIYKGAYIVKNIIDNIGSVDVLGYWLGSDLFSQYRDMNMVLNGGVGLLSRDGIKKPSFYAYDFMNHMGEYMLGRYENSLVTSNGHNDYYIVNHNLKTPNYRYYKTPENEIDINKQNSYFEDAKSALINYRINHVKNGRYQIKIRKINSERGSALDTWCDMGGFANLTIEDVEYLKNVSTADISIFEIETTNDVLNFETQLEANEIQYIHVAYRL